jgi:hypothetical protein
MARNKIAMTAAERQKLERERNNRARQIVVGIGNFALHPVHWDTMRFCTQEEILGALHMVSKWGQEGDKFIEETRLTLPSDRCACTAKVFDRFNINLPFCRDCGADLIENLESGWQQCGCHRTKTEGKKGAKRMAVGSVQTFQIEHTTEADDYLSDLLKNPKYRSMSEVLIRAQRLIPDNEIRAYFVNKAKKLLKAD